MDLPACDENWVGAVEDDLADLIHRFRLGVLGQLSDDQPGEPIEMVHDFRQASVQRLNMHLWSSGGLAEPLDADDERSVHHLEGLFESLRLLADL
ncbi:MAG TPA: hypothetical protein DEW46_06600, partial [Verrucomicrobia bacterium]|nr:hypothetical protein [Verrucomicrobiota bacterium]